MLKLALWIIVAAFAILGCFAGWFFLVPWLAWQLPVTLLAEHRSYAYGMNTEYGYQLEQARWFKTGLKLRIWAGSSLNLQFQVPYGEITKLQTHQWLAHNRAVLLNMEFTLHDSGRDFPGQLALLYDFERGELHSCGTATAWFVWPVPESRNFNTPRCDQLFALVATYPK